MSLFDDLERALHDAMRARDAQRTAALRLVRAAIQVEQKKDGAERLSDETCSALLRRLEKQRRESIDAFESAGRRDRADAERAELAVLLEFLPQLADEAQTRAWVDAAIAETGATAAKDLGRVMGALMKAHKGDVDGNLARRIAAERLAAA